MYRCRLLTFLLILLSVSTLFSQEKTSSISGSDGAIDKPVVSELENEMTTGLPTLIGKNLYAAGFSPRYQPLFEVGIPMDEMLDVSVVDHGGSVLDNGRYISVYFSPHKIPESDIPLFEPLKIVAAKYVHVSVQAGRRERDGVVLTLKLPSGKEAATFVDHTNLEKQLQAHQPCTRVPCTMEDKPLFERVAGSYLTAIPKLTPQEITALKKGKTFPGMRKLATQYSRMPEIPPQQISSYMRNVALLYIETVEKAYHGYDDDSNWGVNIDDTIRHEKLDSQYREMYFKTLTELDDRIEVHSDTQADKDFYKYGLKTLRSLAYRNVSKFHSASVRIISRRVTVDSAERARLKDEADRYSKEAHDLIAPYIHCNSGLRSIIKEEGGRYTFEELFSACKE